MECLSLVYLKMAQDDFSSFRCPISFEIMADPVIAADGHSYERTEIEKWLLTSDLSPLTGAKLTSKHLIPNHTLRQAIENFKTNVSGPHTKANQAQTLSSSQQDRNLRTTITKLDNAVHMSFSLSSEAPTKQLCLIAVLDISGSMSLPAQDQTGEDANTARWSRLDLVKHSMNTAIELLRPGDCLMLITFSDNAVIKLDFTPMSREGRIAAHQAVNSMLPSGGTNLWGGLELAMQRSLQVPGRGDSHTAILLLTDGEPTPSFSPPRGISATLERTLASMPPNMLTIHCFGYGYGKSLDTPLLKDIALQGSGTFQYVPDGSMVGTVFIHFFCNLLSVALTHVSVEVRSTDPKLTIQDRLYRIGYLRPGQTRDVYIPYIGKSDKPNPIEIVTIHNIGQFQPMISNGTPVSGVHFQTLRTKFITCLEQVLDCAQRNEEAKAESLVAALDAELAPYSKDVNIQKLREDLISTRPEKGQILKALQHWSKWGQHYLPSVWFAHVRQEKSSFKDASMEMYSTADLEAMIDSAETTFKNLAPPQASIKPRNGGTRDYTAVPDMSRMMNRMGGCLVASSMVLLEDGTTRVRIDELKAGMRVYGSGMVKNLVRFDVVDTSKQMIYRLKEDDAHSTLGITAWHPVATNGSGWEFPCESDRFVGKVENDCDAVFNVVLEGGDAIEVDGVKCITLGHGLKDKIAFHPYFGSERVLHDLSLMKEDDRGLIWYRNPLFIRSSTSGLIHQICEAPSESMKPLDEGSGTAINFARM